jgi:phage terminase small subunit
MVGKLTLKQKKFIKAYLATGNATQAAKDAGYQSKSDAGYWDMGYQVLRKLEGSISEIMAQMGLDDAMLAQKALEGLNATVVKPFAKDGIVISEPVYVDYATRAKYLEIIARMKGLLKDRVDHVASGMITIRVKGRDAQKAIDVKPIEIDAKLLELPEKVEPSRE